MPGTLIGAMVVDYLGAKQTMCIGLAAQIVIGFILAGVYPLIKSHVAGFAVLYGVFLSFGEFGVNAFIIFFLNKLLKLNPLAWKLSWSPCCQIWSHSCQRSILRNCGCGWQNWSVRRNSRYAPNTLLCPVQKLNSNVILCN